jgi:endonuclease/exonuclease/phosphatase family metal-dependent hydrolase
MEPIKAAFWNLQNLFDVTASDIAADLEFTPAEGWTEEVLDKKFEAIVDIIALMFDGTGPDLLGLCEIENEALAQRLVLALRDRLGRQDYVLAHADSPDIRGIDCSLIYSDDVFELAGTPKGHLVHLRYPTRDIFEVPLRVKQTQDELVVFVNHWPSRSRSGAIASEPLRITVAAHLGRLVDEHLKLPRDAVETSPDPRTLQDVIDLLWNTNVLVMGDLNDDPFDRSVLETLRASNSLDRLEETISTANSQGEPVADFKKSYIGRQAELYNYCWPWMGERGAGTIFFSRGGIARTKQCFDQFIGSRSLVYGLSGLRIDDADVSIFAPKLMWTNSNLPYDTPLHTVRPRRFNRNDLKGHSDHFPITALIREVEPVVG